MVAARSPDLTAAREAAERWISASFGYHLISTILSDAGEPDPLASPKKDLLFQLAHFQYATELAYSRLHGSQATQNPVPGQTWSFEPLFVRAADAHHFVVSACGFWRILEQLRDLWPFDDLRDALERAKDSIAESRTARNHLEHSAERLSEGRRPRSGAAAMSRETFETAIGRLEFPRIVFGSESFDLERLSAEVLALGGDLASAFDHLFQSGIDQYLRVLTGPPENVG